MGWQDVLKNKKALQYKMFMRENGKFIRYIHICCVVNIVVN